MGVITRNIDIKLVLQQFAKQIARFLLPVFPYLKPKPKEILSLIEQRTDGALKFVEIRPTFGQETSGLIWTKTAPQVAHQLYINK